MAVWQASLRLTPWENERKPWRDWHGFGELCRTLDMLYKGNGVPSGNGEELHWGNYDTDDARLLLDDEDRELIVRFDLRRPYQTFVCEYTDATARFGLALETAEGVVEFDEGTAMQAISRSRASLFVSNPAEWMRTAGGLS